MEMDGQMAGSKPRYNIYIYNMHRNEYSNNTCSDVPLPIEVTGLPVYVWCYDSIKMHLNSFLQPLLLNEEYSFSNK